MSTKQKKKRTGLIIVLIVILLALAACGAYQYYMYTQIMQEKAETYATASAYLEAGNYRKAYPLFKSLEDYKDAATQTEKIAQTSAETTQYHMQKAQHLSDLKFNSIAGLYLTEALANEDQYILDDFNKITDTIGAYYEIAVAQYQENQAIDDKNSMTLPVMEILMPRIEALEESKDPVEALDVMSEITTFSLADQVFSHMWSYGAFDGYTLDDLAEGCPKWVPAMDQMIACDENLDVFALVNRS